MIIDYVYIDMIISWLIYIYFKFIVIKFLKYVGKDEKVFNVLIF